MTDTLLEIDWRFSNLFPTLLAKMNATSTTEKGGIKSLKQIGCAMGQGCPVSEHDVPWYICHVTHSTLICFICIEHYMRVFKGWIKRGWHNSDLRCYGRKQISSVFSKRRLEDFYQISFCSSCSLSFRFLSNTS